MLDFLVFIGEFIEVPVVGEVQEFVAEVGGDFDVLAFQAAHGEILIQAAGDEGDALGEVEQSGAIEERDDGHQIVTAGEHAFNKIAFLDLMQAAVGDATHQRDVGVTREAVIGAFVGPARVAVFAHLFAGEGGVIAKTLAIAVDEEEAAEKMLDRFRRAEFGVDSHIGIRDHALVKDLLVLERFVVEEIEQALNHLRQGRLELDDRAGFEGLVGQSLFANGQS